MNAKQCSGCKTITTVLFLLMFAAVSIPSDVSFFTPLINLLKWIPGISVVTEVGDFTLTQYRFSFVELLLFLVPIVLLWQVYKQKLVIRRSWILVVFLVLCLYIAGSAFLNRELYTGLKYVCYLLCASVVSLFDPDKKITIRRYCYRLIVLAGIVNSVALLIQFFMLWNGSLTWTTLRTVRPDGIMLDSIIAGALNSFAVSVILFENKVLRAKDWLQIGLLGISGILTGSRSFYLLLAFILFLYLLSNKGKLTGKLQILIIGLIVIFMVEFAFPSVHEMALEMLSSAGSATDSRAMKQQLALKLFQEHPIFGAGADQYSAYEQSYSHNQISGLNGTNPHNIYLQMLCEHGLVGACLMFLVLAGIVVRMIRARDITALALVGQYLILGYTLGITGNVRITMLICTVCCSITTLYNTKDKKLCRYHRYRKADAPC